MFAVKDSGESALTAGGGTGCADGRKGRCQAEAFGVSFASQLTFMPFPRNFAVLIALFWGVNLCGQHEPGRIPKRGYLIEYDLPAIPEPDSLLLAQISIEPYRPLIRAEEYVQVTDSLLDILIRLYPASEVKRLGGQPSLIVMPPGDADNTQRANE
jgi:hypothetical protein